jgi:hypothetical protein
MMNERKSKHERTTMKTSIDGRQNIGKPMTDKAVARIYSATARQNEGTIPAGGFASRAARGAGRNHSVGSATVKNK